MLDQDSNLAPGTGPLVLLGQSKGALSTLVAGAAAGWSNAPIPLRSILISRRRPSPLASMVVLGPFQDLFSGDGRGRAMVGPSVASFRIPLVGIIIIWEVESINPVVAHGCDLSQRENRAVLNPGEVEIRANPTCYC